MRAVERKAEGTTVAGPCPARPLREEIGGALALLYLPSFLGVLLTGIAVGPDTWGEFLPLLPFAPAALPAFLATILWPAVGVTGLAEIVAGYLVAAALTVAMLQLARIVLRASQPARAFLQASMAGAIALQAWLVTAILFALG